MNTIKTENTVNTENVNVNTGENVTISKEEIPAQQNINITIEQKNKSIMGILSIVFGLLAIFTIGFLAIIGLIMSIVALFKKGNIWLGITGLILNIIAIVVSPTVWVLIAGIFGLSS